MSQSIMRDVESIDEYGETLRAYIYAQRVTLHIAGQYFPVERELLGDGLFITLLDDHTMYCSPLDEVQHIDDANTLHAAVVDVRSEFFAEYSRPIAFSGAIVADVERYRMALQEMVTEYLNARAESSAR